VCVAMHLGLDKFDDCGYGALKAYTSRE
jgi:hypothetical protein